MRYGRTEPTTVYRVVYRLPGEDWQQWSTYSSATARPYVSLASAKGIATDALRHNYKPYSDAEWAVQKSELNWEMVDAPVA